MCVRVSGEVCVLDVNCVNSAERESDVAKATCLGSEYGCACVGECTCVVRVW